MATIKRKCEECGGEIPSHKRSHARFCTSNCQARTGNRRARLKDPEKHREYHNRYFHMRTHGHTRFYDNPLLNKRDKYRAARALGFRSMLEVSVAKQLEDLGVQFQYEKHTFPYHKEAIDAS